MVVFSEAMDGATAGMPGNYLLNPGVDDLPPYAAALGPDGMTVTLYFEVPLMSFPPVNMLRVSVGGSISDINGQFAAEADLGPF